MPPDTPIIRPNEQRLLQAYFDARCDIFLLAQREKLPVLDLLRWSRSPAVQSHIAALKQLTDDSIHLRTAQARLLSLDTLETIVKTTDDPIELRRAASTLFRGGAAMPQPRPPRPKKPDPDNPPPRYLSTKHRAKWGTDPSIHPRYIPPRPTAHDSFSNGASCASTRSTPRIRRNSHASPSGDLPASSPTDGAPSLPPSANPPSRSPKTPRPRPTSASSRSSPHPFITSPSRPSSRRPP